MYKMRLRPGLRPDPAEETHSLPEPLSGFRNGRKRKGKETGGKGWKRRRGKSREGRKG